MIKTQAPACPSWQMLLHLQKLLSFQEEEEDDRRSKKGEHFYQKVESSSRNPQQISAQIHVSREDWEIEVCCQLLCDLDQRSVPLRKEEGDEILMKLLTICVMDVSYLSPQKGRFISTPRSISVIEVSIFSSLLALWQNWYWPPDINICLPFWCWDSHFYWVRGRLERPHYPTLLAARGACVAKFQPTGWWWQQRLLPLGAATEEGVYAFPLPLPWWPAPHPITLAWGPSGHLPHHSCLQRSWGSSGIQPARGDPWAPACLFFLWLCLQWHFSWRPVLPLPMRLLRGRPPSPSVP